VAANNHPPASLLGWLGTQVVPLLPASPEVTLRAPFALLGALLAPALVVAGRRAVGPRAAWLAGGLAALAPLAVDLSRQVRGYAPELLAAGLLAGLVPAALRGRGSWPALAVVTALGVWSHPTLLLAVAPWLALAALLRAGPALAGLAAGAAGGLLLLAPTLKRTARSAIHLLNPHDDEPAARLSLGDLLDVAGGATPDPGLGDRTTPLLVLALAGALLLLAGLGARALVRRGRRMEALALAAPLAAALLLPLSNSPAYPRFAAFALPPLLLLAGRGLAVLAGAGRLRAAALIAGLLAPAALVVSAGASAPLQELRGAARLARQLAGQPGGVVLGAGPGGELVPALDPAALEDPTWATTRTLLGGASRQRVVLVVPLPPWTPGDVAANLSNLGTPVALAGRANVVLVWVVPPRE